MNISVKNASPSKFSYRRSAWQTPLLLLNSAEVTGPCCHVDGTSGSALLSQLLSKRQIPWRPRRLFCHPITSVAPAVLLLSVCVLLIDIMMCAAVVHVDSSNVTPEETHDVHSSLFASVRQSVRHDDALDELD